MRFIHHSRECGLFCCVFNIERFVVIFRIDVHRQIELLRIGARETGVAVGAPLHGSANAIAIAKIDVVAHADFVAVIKDGRSGQARTAARSSVRCGGDRFPARAPADGEFPRLIRMPRSLRIDAVHVIALFVGDHLQRELVVVAQEHGPLAVFRNGRRDAQDVGDRDSGPPCAGP